MTIFAKKKENMKSLMTILLISFNLAVFSQKDEAPDFTYTPTGNIKSSANIGFVLNPLDLDVQIGAALSGGIIISNIAELISAEFMYSRYYAAHSYNALNRRGYMPEDYENLSAKRLDFRLGINFLQTNKSEEYGVTLKSRGNTTYISYMPCNVITSYSAKIGFLRRGFFSKEEDVDFPASTARFNTALLYQTSNVISIGASRKLSIESTFDTDKYGEVSEYKESELYADVLFSIGNNVSAVEKLMYENSTYPNEHSSIIPLLNSEQRAFESFHKTLPVGIRVGARVSGRKMHNVTYNIYGGVYPRTYNGDPIQILNAGMSIGYRFMYKM